MFLQKEPLPLPGRVTASLKTGGANKRNRCQPFFVVIFDAHKYKDNNEGALRFQWLLEVPTLKNLFSSHLHAMLRNCISLLPPSLPFSTVPVSLSPESFIFRFSPHSALVLRSARALV